MAALQSDPCALLPFSAGQLTPMQAIEARHAVRSYTDEPLAPEAVEVLREAIARVNEEANLNIQLVLDEPRAFTGFKARLVNFTNVRNYLALVGPECKELDGIVGYYGEQLVLLAQSLGLNSCWVGGTYKVVNRAYNVDLGQKLTAVVALGVRGHAGHAAPVEGASGGGAGLRRRSGVVPARSGRGPARAHGPEPAEVLLCAGRRRGRRAGGAGHHQARSLHPDGSRHRPMPLRDSVPAQPSTAGRIKTDLKSQENRSLGSRSRSPVGGDLGRPCFVVSGCPAREG